MNVLQTTEMLSAYQAEVEQELVRILSFWLQNALDNQKGGFIGQMTNEGVVVEHAPKGGILHARLLWTFSAAYLHTQQDEQLALAYRAYDYLIQHFWDHESGGIFWSLDADGKPLNTRKQIYAQAFAIYGLSEYHRATKDPQALLRAIELFELIEKHSFDPIEGGYVEAFSKDWELLEDLRLSEKDANEKKIMNTHLHVLEAYTNLYRVWKNKRLARKIRHTLQMFLEHIIDLNTFHQRLYFDDDWTAKSGIISYGHDIEASWLLYEAAEVLEDENLTQKIGKVAVQMAYASARGFVAGGGVNNELDQWTGHHNREKHWWVQAEAMVGFFNAWQLNGDEAFLQKCLGVWDFTKNHILDTQHGEWLWGIDELGKVMASEDKIGFWKCPYHNARACLEIISRCKQNEREELRRKGS